MDRIIDLRSDTVTRPTEEMRKAMYTAEVGDDVLREDQTTILLEETGASMVGKEAAVFVPSGTFGNQLALFTLCERRDEVILSERSHIVQHEAAAAAAIAAVQLRTIDPKGDYLTWDEVSPRIRKGTDVHFPKTGCIAIENALAGGLVQPLSRMQDIKAGASEYQVPVHLDGARIFNAAAYLQKSAAEIAGNADTVMFCLSKGLSAPVGSLLAGDRAIIEKARFTRKVMGGGMRQTGILAAAGIVALKTMTGRLLDDHEKAKRLGKAFSMFNIFSVNLSRIQINMVYVDFCGDNLEAKQRAFIEFLKGKGILTYPPKYGGIRLVTHKDVKEEDIDYIISVLPEFAEKFS